ncbi:PIR protein, putative [Plasmodium sp.]|nr:PIR protein, putative [Plasmodium sp.]
MKLHYCKILLFSFPLNILVSSSNAYNKNKPYIKPHKPTTTSRMLSECSIQTSIYDNDPEMRSVKEIFDRQTSQRFEEYEERMSDRRQKCKEQCDKDIQKIILKDKAQKSLAEKVEKGCLMCACGLGGGVAPVWCLVSGLWYAAWTNYVAGVAAKAATDAGVKEAIKELGNVFELSKVPGVNIPTMVNSTNYFSPNALSEGVQQVNNTLCQNLKDNTFCISVQNPPNVFREVAKVAALADEAGKEAAATEAAKYTSTTSIYSTSIIASVVAIVVIVLVMVIIYLILRYRRKKKKNKKLQYTKLLNQ